MICIPANDLYMQMICIGASGIYLNLLNMCVCVWGGGGGQEWVQT